MLEDGDAYPIMGCHFSADNKHKVSAKTRKNYLVQNTTAEDDCGNHQPRQPERPVFSEEQKTVVKESWQFIQEDIAKVGVVMFMNLFETHPDVQDVFMPFKGMSKEDLSHSTQLRSHALRVMGTVEKCLSRIDEPKKLEEMLHELGARHVMYSAKVDYIDLIGPQFIFAIAPALGDRWTPDMESAWSDLFKFISHIIKEAMMFY